MWALADAYMHLGRRDEALTLHRELLGFQTAAAEAPAADADSLNSAAWALLTYEIEELRDPELALAYAGRACKAEEAAGGAKLWMCLDTLALAQHMTGDTAAAVENERRAISLLPSDAPEDARRALTANLQTFEAALMPATQPATAGPGDDR